MVRLPLPSSPPQSLPPLLPSTTYSKSIFSNRTTVPPLLLLLLILALVIPPFSILFFQPIHATSDCEEGDSSEAVKPQASTITLPNSSSSSPQHPQAASYDLHVRSFLLHYSAHRVRREENGAQRKADTAAADPHREACRVIESLLPALGPQAEGFCSVAKPPLPSRIGWQTQRPQLMVAFYKEQQEVVDKPEKEGEDDEHKIVGTKNKEKKEEEVVVGEKKEEKMVEEKKKKEEVEEKKDLLLGTVFATPIFETSTTNLKPSGRYPISHISGLILIHGIALHGQRSLTEVASYIRSAIAELQTQLGALNNCYSAEKLSLVARAYTIVASDDVMLLRLFKQLGFHPVGQLATGGIFFYNSLEELDATMAMADTVKQADTASPIELQIMGANSGVVMPYIEYFNTISAGPKFYAPTYLSNPMKTYWVLMRPDWLLIHFAKWAPTLNLGQGVILPTITENFISELNTVQLKAVLDGGVSGSPADPQQLLLSIDPHLLLGGKDGAPATVRDDFVSLCYYTRSQAQIATSLLIAISYSFVPTYAPFWGGGEDFPLWRAFVKGRFLIANILFHMQSLQNVQVYSILINATLQRFAIYRRQHRRATIRDGCLWLIGAHKGGGFETFVDVALKMGFVPIGRGRKMASEKQIRDVHMFDSPEERALERAKLQKAVAKDEAAETAAHPHHQTDKQAHVGKEGEDANKVTASSNNDVGGGDRGGDKPNPTSATTTSDGDDGGDGKNGSSTAIDSTEVEFLVMELLHLPVV